MNLDWQLCSRARLARDARFDGKFYIAVLTTRIYCRPICRSRTSQEKNVRYFASAAAAAEAGFRPCLRCRPECSPGTAAWAGTKNTVSRALRLINETGLEEGGVEALAAHLGVGSRHLRRLFLRHLGATPTAVAQTRRLHFAKKLIDETRLSMTQIAIASGFGSVRRFNAAIDKVYHRTPTQIRDLAPRAAAQAENQYLLRLDFRPPYAWKRMLEVLAVQAMPGVEAVDDGGYRRTISSIAARGYLEVTLDEQPNGLRVRVQISDPRLLFNIIERLRDIFDLNADWATIERTLNADPVLAARLERDPGLRVAGGWSGFELAIRAILGQQAGASRALVLAGRLVTSFGIPFCAAPGLTHLFPTPEVLADADLESVGLPKTRSEAIRVLARAVCDGRVSFEKVADPDAVVAQLSRVPGLSKRTVEYVAMRALRDPDAFPYTESDLPRLMGLGSAAELEERSRAWRPWRAYAAAYLGETSPHTLRSPSRKAANRPRPLVRRPLDHHSVETTTLRN
jgi:AraC family transcriptional regulator, regulatory protein of adaptative response / DNA-3-methyladenine glycosylase II